jgi:holin-like protein
MLESLTLLLCCQLAGELLARATGLPVPGPVLGMLILLLGLVLYGRVPPALSQVGGALLEHLALLFVPAGVGVMAHLALLRAQWLPVSLALVVSTLLAAVVTGWVMRRLSRSGGDGGHR